MSTILQSILRPQPRIYCCCSGCLNSSIKKPHMSFFKLPSDEQRRKEWLRLISREDLADKKAKSYVVCEEHFHAHEILRAEHRKNLKKNAVPSLNLPGAQAGQVVAFEVFVRDDAGTQTQTSLDPAVPSSSTSLKRRQTLKSKPNKKFHQNDEANSQKETFYKLCDTFLPRELAELVKVRQTWAGKGRNKLSSSITTEINEKVMAILQIKVQHMAEKARNCSLIIDTIDLKPNLVYNTKVDRITGFHEVDGVQTPEPATAALVLLLRGIVYKWQQPIGFALLSEYRNYDEIRKWIDKLVDRLFEMGLHIRTFVSDMGDDVYNLAQEWSISADKPFFFNNYNKIYYVFDPPDLMVLFRDSLLVNDFHYQGRVANIEPVRELQRLARERGCKLVALTASHLAPRAGGWAGGGRDARLAAQLLSHPVAAAMSNYIDFYVMDESARDTVTIIKLMNDLFNILNAVSVDHYDSDKKVFSGEEGQLKILDEAITFFKSLKLVECRSGREVTSSARFIEGFQMTINSVMMMLEDLNRKGVMFLRTRWLNKEPTEKLFTQIRTTSGDPKSHQFISSFRDILVTDLMKPPRGRDCYMEVAKLLADFASEEPVASNVASDSKHFIKDIEKDVRVKCSDYNQLELRHEHTVVFLSSFLLSKCAERHVGCRVMRAHISPQRGEAFQLDPRYQRYRDYSRLVLASLQVVPSDDFIRYVEIMDQEFRSVFKRKHIDEHIAAAIYKEIRELSFAPPCPCFPSVYLKKLFIRMRIFHTMQFNNANLRSLGDKRKYFSVPNL